MSIKDTLELCISLKPDQDGNDTVNARNHCWHDNSFIRSLYKTSLCENTFSAKTFAAAKWKGYMADVSILISSPAENVQRPETCVWHNNLCRQLLIHDMRKPLIKYHVLVVDMVIRFTLSLVFLLLSHCKNIKNGKLYSSVKNSWHT